MTKVVAAILGLIGFFALRQFLLHQYRTVITAATTDKAARCLVMLGNTTSEQDGFTFIIGSIRNNCDQKFGSVTITFKLDPPSGSTAYRTEGIAYAYSRDVQPHETRQFKSAVHISNATYRFDAIRAF